ncbi:MAG: hypothetical protein ABIF71_11685 [Planctomycetota bacterium]
MPRLHNTLPAAILAGWLLAVGCGTDKAGPGTDGRATWPVHQTKQKGPLEVTLSADRDTATLADMVSLVIETRIERGWTLTLREEGLLPNEGFLVRDVREEERSDPGSMYRTRTFTLEPLVSGKAEVPALTLSFAKEGQEYSLATDPFSITVTGLSEAERAGLVLRDITPPRAMPVPPARWPWYGAAALAVAAAVAAGFWIAASRRRRLVPAIPPDIRALNALQDLARRGLIEQGAFDQFYYHITWILRVFIRERFGIHAPERTSEEFLHEMDTHPAFPAAFKPRLRAYLDHCDRVKYAHYRPATAEIQTIFDLTREFIVAAGSGDAPKAS